MSTHLIPPPERILPGRWWRKYSGKTNSLLSNTSQKKTKTLVTTKKSMAGTLAETFAASSSVSNSNPVFLAFKNNAEKQKPNVKSNNSEKYNQLFTPAELQETIKTSHHTAVGLLISKTSTKISHDYLLTKFNDIWINSKFPES